MDNVRQTLAEGKHLDTLAETVRSCSHVEIEDILVRFHNWLPVLEKLIGEFTQVDLSDDGIANLHREMRNVARQMGRTRDRLRMLLNNAKDRYQAPVMRTGTVGRPRYALPAEQLLMFHELGFTWTAMLGKCSFVFKNSPSTLRQLTVKPILLWQ